MKVRTPLKPRNPEKFKVASKVTKKWLGAPQSDPKNNPDNNIFDSKNHIGSLFRSKNLLFGLLSKVTFWSVLSYFDNFGASGVRGGPHFHKHVSDSEWAPKIPWKLNDGGAFHRVIQSATTPWDRIRDMSVSMHVDQQSSSEFRFMWRLPSSRKVSQH